MVEAKDDDLSQREHYLDFQFHMWNNLIQGKTGCRTFTTKTINVSHDFVERYFMSDGIFLPEKIPEEL
jgi:hypothetical protein